MGNQSQSRKERLDKKIILIVAIFVTMALSIVLISFFGTKIVNGARAYVAGEGLWTKAEKEAVLHLTRYVMYKEIDDYRKFQIALEVPKGDKQARKALMSPDPSDEKAYQGFLQGDNHPEDIPRMIWLFKNFKDFSYIKEAIDIWIRADVKIEELDSLGAEIHRFVQENQSFAPSLENRFIDEIYRLDEELAKLERAFSSRMGEAARWASSIIFWITVVIMLGLILISGIVSVRMVQRIQSMNRQLKSTERRFRNVLDNSRDVIYQMDLETGQYVFMSGSVESMIGYITEEMLEKGTDFVIEGMHPEDRKRMQEELEEIKEEDIKDHFKTHTEFRFKTKSGEYVWVSNKRTLLLDEHGNPEGVVGSVRDISDRKAYEEELDKSLQEKEVLLQEIHHRVKNNLAIISGLLELQKEGVDPEVAGIFEESQSRIQSIAIVHEKLYKSDTLSDITMDEYIDELVETIHNAYTSEWKKIKIEKNLDEIRLDIKDAIPCGLIFNELVNNVYKHAFADRKEGTLTISLQKNGSSCVLSVADNGRGLPDDFSIEESRSLGMNLVKTLSRQLEAELEISSNGDTEFRIEFQPSEASGGQGE